MTPHSFKSQTVFFADGKPKNPAIEAVMSDSRRGSLIPNGSRRGSGQRSRCGSISLGGVERRGSYYSEDVSKRSTVAVVVDDPEGKKQMTDALKGVFEDELDGRNGETFAALIIKSKCVSKQRIIFVRHVSMCEQYTTNKDIRSLLRVGALV